MKFEEVQFATGTYGRVTRREAYGMLLTRGYIYMQDSKAEMYSKEWTEVYEKKYDSRHSMVVHVYQGSDVQDILEDADSKCKGYPMFYVRVR